MKKKRTLSGFGGVMRNLNKAVTEIEGKSMRGLIEASALVRRSMEDNEPYIPLDTGHLRASWTTHSYYKSGNPAVVIGFLANYAAAVHEMPKDYSFSKPGSGPKFFESALQRERRNILKVIHDTAKIG